MSQEPSSEETELTGETATSPSSPRARRRASSEGVVLRLGARVGRYEVLEELGKGGMGVVYRARDHELDRDVALKLVTTSAKEGEDRGSARLLREAQALAQLAHPNVTAIYDVGRYQGAVFLAMELIEGERLDVWMKRAVRPWREVRRVFRDAGRGLEAAHAAGLIHRDFKPANVMLGKDGRVRVLDFGLARVAEDPLTVDPTPTAPGDPAAALRHLADERTGDSRLDTPVTQIGAVVGTPSYMAPEQHRGAVGDARSDQFSFCVTFYQALYGERPFAGAFREELREAIREGRIRPAPKDRKVPGWIRRIVVRGLAAAPAARWPSMAALLDALDADPGQRWRRAGAVAGVTALAGVAVVALWRGGEGAAPCGDAEAQLRTIWDPAQKAAVRKVFMASSRPFAAAAFAEVERSLDDYARAWAVMNTEACEATAVHKVQSEELLDLRMQCLGERKDELRAQVEVLASADATVIEHAAQAAHALPPVSQCADIEALRAPVRPPADPAIQTRVGAMRRELATVKALLASGRYADGLTRATALAGQAAEVGYRPFQAEALFDLGQLQEVTGDYAAAAKALREAGIAAEAGRHDQMAARAWIQLVWVIGPRLGKAEDAELLAKEAAAKLERFGKDDLMRADLDRTLGQMASDQGKWEQALGYARQALALRQKALPPHDTAIALAESDVADALVQEGRHDDALDAYRRALADMEAALGPDHPMLISTLTNLATALRAKARYDEAGAVFDRAQAIALRTYGPDHPALATIFMDRGGVERAQGKLDAAVAHYQRALAIWEKALGPDNASVGTPHYYLGVVALQQDRFDDALVEFRRALDIWQKALGPDHPSLSAALDGIGDALMAKGQPREALAQFERGVLLLEKAEGPTHPDLAGGLTGQGLALVALHQARRATPLLERAHEILVANPGDPIDLARTEFALAQALVDADGDAAVQTRARGLAEHARAAYAANPGARRETEAVLAWQAKHP